MFITIQQATPEDGDTVFAVLDEAADWLRRNGIVQWPERFSGVDDWRSVRIQSHIKAGQVWMVRIHSEVAGVFILAEADPNYAHGWPSDVEDGLYIYRMAMRREHAGNKLGQHMLNWASARAAALGYSWLRLDCHRNNEPLQRYYENAGFERVGTVVADIDPGGSIPSGESYTRGSGALYQREAGTMQIGGNDAYDPTGEAAVWQQASELAHRVTTNDATESIVDPWNTAIEQVSRALESEARGIRQRNSMYYRVISGSTA